ncbi:MAG: class A beta-lactamase-related serine hydrolase [Cyclobacteriaceae bacterium]|jgi:hypothetical protein|nr:class A beta-lactamase-related serine hydrolase [Cyclobacteriaceae bacterium]
MKPLFGSLAVALLLVACQREITPDKNLLENLMKARPELFSRLLAERDTLEVQLIYTQIDRDENNVPAFRTFSFNVDSNRYFYPASTIKLPMVLLALEKLHDLDIEGLDRFTPMFHDSAYHGQLSAHADTTSASGLPSIDHYAKKILIVSDNDASNRLYEFVGQQRVNESLNARGYRCRIVHRLERPLTPDENRHTEAVRFVKDGQVLFQQPMLVNTDSLRPDKIVKKGSGFLRNNTVINEPFDFTYKNFYPITTQQKLLRALLFPESVPAAQRFNLTPEERRAVLAYMSQWPRESDYPPYAKDTTLYDAYCKFFMYGEDRQPVPQHIRIFNKVGDAYGFLLDNAYIVDFENKVEFMLTAVINTNTDGVYNDGRYEYSTVGFPFFKDIGRAVYDYELQRKRPHVPDLSAFKLTYSR